MKITMEKLLFIMSLDTSLECILYRNDLSPVNYNFAGWKGENNCPWNVAIHRSLFRGKKQCGCKGTRLHQVATFIGTLLYLKIAQYNNFEGMFKR